MPFADLNGLKLYYEIQGQGPRLLFITGTASDLRQELTVFKSPLIKYFEVLSLDQRGIGQSNSPDPQPKMEDYAKDIQMLLDYIGWEKCYVMGESFGGMVAQEFAIRHPKYAEKCVLIVTSSGGKGGSSFPYHKHDTSTMSLEERADCFVNWCDTRMTDPTWKIKNPELYQMQFQNYLEVFKFAAENPNRALFNQRQLMARKGHNTYDRLSQLKMPTYIGAGHYDNTAPLKNQLALLSQIPDARLGVFNGSHTVLWQDHLLFEHIITFLNYNESIY